MIRHSVVVAFVLLSTGLIMVSSAKQQLQLSDSYLPVAMQIIAHVTDQLTYEAKDEPSKPVASKPITAKPFTTTSRRPSRKPTTPTPLDLTTPLHKPGLYAPQYPPKPEDRKDNKNQQEFILQPDDKQPEYTVIQPVGELKEETFISNEDDEVDPLSEPSSDSEHLLPPVDTHNASGRSDDDDDEYVEENLQYLYPNVRDLIKLAHDPEDDRLVDVWDGERSGPPLLPNKATASLSAPHLRLLLLYDLLSREAKKQKLSDFHGFSDEVLQRLEETSNGGARAQLSFALSKMLERHDCGHDYANNRAREIVAELGKDDSKFSSELRYLNPLRYSL